MRRMRWCAQRSFILSSDGIRAALRTTLVVILSAAPWAGAPQARAQQTVPLKAGDQVRVTWPESGTARPVRGVVLELQTDVLVVGVTRRGVRTLEHAAVDLNARPRIERRVRESATGRGALMGAGLGGAAAVLFSVSACGCSPGEFCIVSQEACIVGSGAVGAALGAIIGAIAAPGERWEPVPLASVAGSIGLGLRVRSR